MSTKQMRKQKLSLIFLMLLGALQPAFAEETIVFAGQGGDYQKKIVQALIQPAAKNAEVGLKTETLDGLATVRVQVVSKSPAWDIVQLGGDECAAGSSQGLFEKLDYSKIDTKGIPKDAYGTDWIASNYYSVVIAYRTDKFRNGGPKNWADFWDVKKFPGKRALALQPQETLEIALLADGVTPDKLYPLDQKRAIASLERLKPEIATWWTTGAQSIQLLHDNAVDMEAIYGSRIAPLMQSGAPVAYTFNQGILGYGCLAILKGSKHVAEAQRVIAQVVSPAIQANIPETLQYYGPVNEDAFKVRKFSQATLDTANSSPENRKKQVLLNASYWGNDNNNQKGNDLLREMINR
jgi:putative spermidine/putrescine transport system substrate-binding protein